MIDSERNCIIKGDYAICAVKNAFNGKTSYWVSKKGYTVSFYCFSEESKSDTRHKLTEGLDSYIDLFETAYKRLYEPKDTFDHSIDFEISVFERNMIVLFDGDDALYEKVQSILSARYAEWLLPPNVATECDTCEAYMLRGLDEIGLRYKAIYVGKGI